MDTISEEVGTMLRLHLSPLFALLMVLLTGTSAHAATILFADLTNAQENPPANPTTSLGAPGRHHSAPRPLY